MRTFVSTIERWPGTLVTRDFLSWSEFEKWELALKQAQEVGDETSVASFFSILFPVALSVIREWHIKGLPEKIESTDDLPASSELAAFIVDCISKLFRDTNEIEQNSQG